MTVTADPGGHQTAQVAGAASQIQNLLAGLQTGHVDGKTFPQTVNAERHGIVHQVVVVSDGIEHIADTPNFFIDGHITKTEMSGFV